MYTLIVVEQHNIHRMYVRTMRLIEILSGSLRMSLESTFSDLIPDQIINT